METAPNIRSGQILGFLELFTSANTCAYLSLMRLGVLLLPRWTNNVYLSLMRPVLLLPHWTRPTNHAVHTLGAHILKTRTSIGFGLCLNAGLQLLIFCRVRPFNWFLNPTVFKMKLFLLMLVVNLPCLVRYYKLGAIRRGWLTLRSAWWSRDCRFFSRCPSSTTSVCQSKPDKNSSSFKQTCQTWQTIHI